MSVQSNSKFVKKIAKKLKGTSPGWGYGPNSSQGDLFIK